MSRILSLTDGVFAFALTLLALTLTVPLISNASSTFPARTSSELAAHLQSDYLAFLGYAFAFVMIGVWWINHNRSFQYIARYDHTLVWLNMALLLEIAVTPFVMSVFSDYSYTQVAVALFASIQVALGLTNTILWDYARRANLMKPTVTPEIQTLYSRRGWLTSAVFVISIGLSFVSLTAAELSWIGTFVVQRSLERHAVRAGAP